MENMSARILVVDDDRALAEMLGMVLQGEGFVTEFSVDGAEAVEKFREMRPDLVLLDVMLPGLDGIEVTDRGTAARALAGALGVPLVPHVAADDADAPEPDAADAATQG